MIIHILFVFAIEIFSVSFCVFAYTICMKEREFLLISVLNLCNEKSVVIDYSYFTIIFTTENSLVV